MGTGGQAGLAPGGIVGREHAVVLVGIWRPLLDDPDSCRAAGIHLSPSVVDPAVLKALLVSLRPTWILVGYGEDERRLASMVAVGRQTLPELKVAAIGPANDLDRCERWLRRGCAVYLTAGTPLDRLLIVLRCALDMGVVICDETFQSLALARSAATRAALPDADALTRRELQVLTMMRLGLRNAQIASQLRLSRSTVEFHVSNVLGKLAASNRTEAVERANLLAIAMAT